MLRALSDDLLVAAAAGPLSGLRAAGRAGVRARARRRCAPAPPAPPLPGVAWSAAVFAYEGVARELVARVEVPQRARLRCVGSARELARVCATRAVRVRRRHVGAGERAPRGARAGSITVRCSRARSRAELGVAAASACSSRDDGPPQTGRAADERRARARRLRGVGRGRRARRCSSSTTS